jgi:hypothetical protein
MITIFFFWRFSHISGRLTTTSHCERPGFSFVAIRVRYSYNAGKVFCGIDSSDDFGLTMPVIFRRVRKIAKKTINFVVSVCPSVRLRGITRFPLDAFS